MASLPPDALLNLIHIVISSTMLDLPQHREAAIKGVWQGLHRYL